MSHLSRLRIVRIEMDRGNGWELREERMVAAGVATAARIKRDLVAYAVEYRHRAVLDGFVVAEVTPAAWRRSAGTTGI